MARWCGPGSLAPGTLTVAPCFVNIDYVTAEITYTVPVSHEVLASHGLLCVVAVRASPWKPWLLLGRDYTGTASWLCYMRLRFGHGYVMAVSMKYCISQERGCVMATMPARRECVCSSSGSSSSFQPLSLCLAYPGFNKYCEQWELASQTEWRAINLDIKFFFVLFLILYIHSKILAIRAFHVFCVLFYSEFEMFHII